MHLNPPTDSCNCITCLFCILDEELDKLLNPPTTVESEMSPMTSPPIVKRYLLLTKMNYHCSCSQPEVQKKGHQDLNYLLTQ